MTEPRVTLQYQQDRPASFRHSRGRLVSGKPASFTGRSTTARLINKLSDFQDLNQLARRAVIDRLFALKQVIDQTGLPYGSANSDDWMRLWEYSQVVLESGVDSRMTVLDAGGSGTIFSFYLAAEGCSVITIDLNAELVAHAQELSKRLRLPITHLAMDIRSMRLPDEHFDRVFCMSVIEHVPREDQTAAIQQLARVLKPGGLLSITFDYGIHAADNPILSPEEVRTRLIEPSGLMVLGNEDFLAECADYGHTGPTWIFGSLFLHKPGQLQLPLVPEHPIAPFPWLRR